MTSNGAGAAPTFQAAGVTETGGTWTPVITDDSLSGAESQATSTAVGTWRRYGDTIHVWGKFDVSSLGSLTTSQGLKIIGLPVAAVNVANYFGIVSMGDVLGLSITAGYSLTGYITANTSHITVKLWDATNGNSALLLSELTAGGSMNFHSVYRAA